MLSRPEHLYRHGTARRKAFAVAGLLLCWALAGCAADGVEPGTEAGAETGTGGSKPSVAPLQPSPPAEPAAPPPPPDLMGKQRTEIIEILGRPAFSRRDRPALLLRYRQDGCILDLFLYPVPRPSTGDTALGQAVEHIEARSITGQKMIPKACIAAVIKARTTKQQG